MSIINPWIFYWINILDNISIFCIIAALISVCIIIVDIIERYESRKICIICGIVLTICTLFIIFIPSKETMYAMLIADNVTYENVDYATNAIKDGVDYIFEKIEGSEEK
ncbi:MAG: hypothetical protein ACLUVC_02260 [Longibaculum sp.]